MVMADCAGWFFGTSGIRRQNRGERPRLSISTMPECSAMRKMPSQSAMRPISPMAIFTALSVISKMARMISLNTSGWPKKRVWTSAAPNEATKKVIQTRFSTG